MIGGYHTALMGVIAGGKRRGDPLFNNVEFLVSPYYMATGNSADDQSSQARTSTRIGTAVVSSAMPLFDGPTLDLTSTSSSGWSYPIGTTSWATDEDMCLEAWVRIAGRDVAYNAAIFGTDSGSSGPIGLAQRNAPAGLWRAFGISGTNSAAALNNNQWYHLAVTVTGTGGGRTVRYFVDGVLDTEVVGGPLASSGLTTIYVGGDLINGQPSVVPSPRAINGYIGGVRLTVGNKRYPDTGFPVPTEPFPIT